MNLNQRAFEISNEYWGENEFSDFAGPSRLSIDTYRYIGDCPKVYESTLQKLTLKLASMGYTFHRIWSGGAGDELFLDRTARYQKVWTELDRDELEWFGLGFVGKLDIPEIADVLIKIHEGLRDCKDTKNNYYTSTKHFRALIGHERIYKSLIIDLAKEMGGRGYIFERNKRHRGGYFDEVRVGRISYYKLV